MGVELISMGRRKPEGGTTGVPMLRTGLSYSAEVQLLLYALRTWHEVQQCVFDCCTERVSVIMARSPTAVHQPHAHTP